MTTNIDADTDNGDHEDSAGEVNNGIMSRRRNKKASRVTVKEEFLLLPPSEDLVGKGGFCVSHDFVSMVITGHLCCIVSSMHGIPTRQSRPKDYEVL